MLQFIFSLLSFIWLDSCLIHLAFNKYIPHFFLCYDGHLPQKTADISKMCFTYGLVWNLYGAFCKKRCWERFAYKIKGGVGGFFSLKSFFL